MRFLQQRGMTRKKERSWKVTASKKMVNRGRAPLKGLCYLFIIIIIIAPLFCMDLEFEGAEFREISNSDFFLTVPWFCGVAPLFYRDPSL